MAGGAQPRPPAPCYDYHPAWGAALAAGYATARIIHATEAADTADTAFSPEEARQLSEVTTVVPAGQLAEWLLDDLRDLDG